MKHCNVQCIALTFEHWTLMQVNCTRLVCDWKESINNIVHNNLTRVNHYISHSISSHDARTHRLHLLLIYHHCTWYVSSSVHLNRLINRCFTLYLHFNSIECEEVKALYYSLFPVYGSKIHSIFACYLIDSISFTYHLYVDSVSNDCKLWLWTFKIKTFYLNVLELSARSQFTFSFHLFDEKVLYV